VVLVWRLDRWGRSVTDLLATLQELEHLGVGERRRNQSYGKGWRRCDMAIIERVRSARAGRFGKSSL